MAASPEYRSTITAIQKRIEQCFNWLHRQNTGQLAVLISTSIMLFQLAASPEYRSTRTMTRRQNRFNCLHRQNTGQQEKKMLTQDNSRFQLACIARIPVNIISLPYYDQYQFQFGCIGRIPQLSAPPLFYEPPHGSQRLSTQLTPNFL
ncbi:hypothetical protein BGS_1055 [Beggiatoa sp. SS]|nr:hypothetical protein BGS_1055 [Beggiatoa sp. SS]